MVDDFTARTTPSMLVSQIQAGRFNEYARRSDLKDVTPEAVDMSLSPARACDRAARGSSGSPGAQVGVLGNASRSDPANGLTWRTRSHNAVLQVLDHSGCSFWIEEFSLMRARRMTGLFQCEWIRSAVLTFDY